MIEGLLTVVVVSVLQEDCLDSTQVQLKTDLNFPRLLDNVTPKLLAYKDYFAEAERCYGLLWK